MHIIESMVGWPKNLCQPGHLVDPGAGSGRFVLAAAEVFPHIRLVGIELDPVVASLLRANIAVRDLSSRTITIHVADYRRKKSLDRVCAFRWDDVARRTLEVLTQEART